MKNEATIDKNTAFSRIPAPDTAEALVDALRDPAWCVRTGAAWALREINGPRVVRLFERSLDEDGATDLDHFVGIIDEVKVFHAALTAEELAEFCHIEEEHIHDTTQETSLHGARRRMRQRSDWNQ